MLLATLTTVVRDSQSLALYADVSTLVLSGVLSLELLTSLPCPLLTEWRDMRGWRQSVVSVTSLLSTVSDVLLKAGAT